jgi:hypothetical protein
MYLADLRPPEVRVALPAETIPPRPSEPGLPRVQVRRTRVSGAGAPIRRTAGPPPLVEPLVVKLVTDDPDIVIYWIADRKGDDQ